MKEEYKGFELGPIRPPSEANSLLLRVTRNCPWNRCKFCGLYKGEKYSVRPVEHLVRDIDTVARYLEEIGSLLEQPGGGYQTALLDLQSDLGDNDRMAIHAALTWMRGGMKSVFLQDANSLACKPDDLVNILNHLRETFPQIERVTSYARSRTVARISDEDMARLAAAGLNRVHIGMESGADEVLEFVRKIELSEYFMPGLGGAALSKENALETADAINQIDPDFIRIRTLAIPEQVELFGDVQSGGFSPMGDLQMAEELLLFLDNLDGIESTVKNDHILNLFQEVEGALPGDKEAMTAPIRKFLAMSEEEQLLYIVGRRAGIFSRLEDLNDPGFAVHAKKIRDQYRVTMDNMDDFTADMIKRFI
jgi:hypothetical protein